MTVPGRKKIKRILLLFLKFAGIFTLARHLTRRGVRILCYHGIWLGQEGYPGDAMFMKAETFEYRLRALRKWGFPVISLDQATKMLGSGELPPCAVVITIDDGWYSTYRCMVPVLRQYAMDATLYCDTAHLQSNLPVPHVMARYLKALVGAGYLTCVSCDEVATATLYEEATDIRLDQKKRMVKAREFAAAMTIDLEPYLAAGVFNYMDASQLAEAYKSGLDVQLHTHTHSMHDYKKEQVADEINENRNQLSSILGMEPHSLRHLCYPSGACSKELGPFFDEIGVSSCTTVEQAIAFKNDDAHFLPRIMDGEHLSLLDFEAELSGVMEIMRMTRRFLSSGART